MQTSNIISLTSVVIAAIALYFSPKIQNMVRRKEIRQIVARSIYPSNDYGNTSLTLWIDIENTGGKKIAISQIKCFLFHENDYLQTLTAMIQFSEDTTKQLPFSEIRIKPGQYFSGYIGFWDIKQNTPKYFQELSNIRQHARREKEEIEREKTRPENKHKIKIERSDKLIGEALTLVKSRQKLQVGTYQLLFCMYEDPIGEENIKKSFPCLGYEFTLYPNDIHNIFEDIDENEYKEGYGLDINKRKGDTPAPVLINRLADEKRGRLLNSLR